MPRPGFTTGAVIEIFGIRVALAGRNSAANLHERGVARIPAQALRDLRLVQVLWVEDSMKSSTRLGVLQLGDGDCENVSADWFIPQPTGANRGERLTRIHLRYG